jgi:hypothetical protein
MRTKKIFGINFLQIYSMMKHTKKRYDGKQIVQHRTSMSESKKTMFITQSQEPIEYSVPNQI